VVVARSGTRILSQLQCSPTTTTTNVHSSTDSGIVVDENTTHEWNGTRMCQSSGIATSPPFLVLSGTRVFGGKVDSGRRSPFIHNAIANGNGGKLFQRISIIE
jgi:hypothetical protein